jgi:hypothetical protein
MCCQVVWYIITDILEEHPTSVFKLEEYSEDGQSIFLWNIGIDLPDCMTLHPRVIFRVDASSVTCCCEVVCLFIVAENPQPGHSGLSPVKEHGLGCTECNKNNIRYRTVSMLWTVLSSHLVTCPMFTTFPCTFQMKCNAELNAWSYTDIFPYIFMAWYAVKYEDNCTFHSTHRLFSNFWLLWQL